MKVIAQYGGKKRESITVVNVGSVETNAAEPGKVVLRSIERRKLAGFRSNEIVGETDTPIAPYNEQMDLAEVVSLRVEEDNF
jgi:hypothetical protein